jgi:serine protease Do
MLRSVSFGLLAVSVLTGFARGQESASPDPWKVTVFQGQGDGLVRLWSQPYGRAINFIGNTYGSSLGMDVGEVDAGLRSQLELPESTGVLVTAVHAESDAAKAGFQQYDVVLKVDETAVTDTKGFHDLMNAQQGKEVKLHVLRKGKPAIVSMVLPKTPVYEFTTANLWTLDPNVLTVYNPPQYRIGVTLAEADETLRRQLRLAQGEGLVVTEVVPESPAAKAGLQAHDVLIKLDGKRLTTVDALNAQVQELKEQATKVVLFREGRELTREVAARLDNTASMKVHTLGVDFDGLGMQPYVTSQFVNQDTLGVYLGPADGRPHLLDVWTRPQPASAAPATPGPTAAEQMAALKRQLADVQKAVEKLEAALKTAEPQDPPPEDKK